MRTDDFARDLRRNVKERGALRIAQRIEQRRARYLSNTPSECSILRTVKTEMTSGTERGAGQ